MSNYDKGYTNANDDAQRADQAYRSAANTGYRAYSTGKKAGKAFKAAQTAQKGKKVAAAAKAAGAAKAIVSAKAIGIAILCILGFVVILAAIELLPSLISNSFTKANDAEALADGQSITDIDYDALGTAKDKISSTEQIVTDILQKAYSETYSELMSVDVSLDEIATYKSAFPGEVVFDTSRLSAKIPTSLQEDSYIVLASAYSASMKNGLTEDAFNYYGGLTNPNGYQSISAAEDFKNKLQAIASLDNPVHPIGNYFYGGDFSRTGMGKIIPSDEVTITYTYIITGNELGRAPKATLRDKAVDDTGNVINVSDIEGQAYAPSREEINNAWGNRGGATSVTIQKQKIIYYVEPIMYQNGWRSILSEAFGFDFSESYDDESASSTTFHDIIVEMCNTLGREVYPDTWQDVTGITNIEVNLNSNSSLNSFSDDEKKFYYQATNKLAIAALSQLHRGGSQPNAYHEWYIEYVGGNSKYRPAQGEWDWTTLDWCAIFVSWCMYKCGMLDDWDEDAAWGTSPIAGTIFDYDKYKNAGVSEEYGSSHIAVATARCWEFKEFFKARNTEERPEYYSHDSGYIPKQGDLVLFDWPPHDGTPDHIAVVVSTYNNDSQMWYVGGNQSCGKCTSSSYTEVTLKTIELSSANIHGFCVPDYPDDYTSQDVLFSEWIHKEGYNGCDTAAYHSTQAQADAAASQFDWMGRYIGNQDDVGGKIPMDKEEYWRLLNAGIGVQTIYQINRMDPADGAPKGCQQGLAATEYMLNELDAPEGTTIYFCWDYAFDAGSDDLEAVIQFLNAAAAEAEKGGYTVGMYGPAQLIDALGERKHDLADNATGYWQCIGYSNNLVSEQITSYQASNGKDVEGLAFMVDLNYSSNQKTIGYDVYAPAYIPSQVRRELERQYARSSAESIPSDAEIDALIEDWFNSDSYWVKYANEWLDSFGEDGAMCYTTYEGRDHNNDSSMIDIVIGNIIHKVTSTYPPDDKFADSEYMDSAIKDKVDGGDDEKENAPVPSGPSYTNPFSGAFADGSNNGGGNKLIGPSQANK